MERQFCATVYILKDEQVFLIYHRKLEKWLPAGGHIDPGETPPEAAIREAKEETGMDVRLIPQENLWVKEHNAASFERPFLCLLEEIPAHGDQPAHQHMDFVYLGEPIGGAIEVAINEVADGRWFSLNEILAMEGDKEIFKETKQVLAHIFSQGVCT